MEFLGIEDQFFTARLSRMARTSRSGIGRRITPLAGGTRAGSGNGCGNDDRRAAADARLRGPEGSGAAQQGEAVARSTDQFRLDRNYRQAAAVRPAVAAPVHSQLRLGDRLVHAGPDNGAVSRFASRPFAFHAKDAGRGAGNPLDSGSLQEIFDERSAQAEDERRSDGRLPARGHQSDGQLPADAAAASVPVGVLPDAFGRH